MDNWAIIALHFCKPVAIQQYESAQWIYFALQPFIEWTEWERRRMFVRLQQLREAQHFRYIRKLDYKWQKVTHLLEFDNWLLHQLRLFRALRLTRSALTYKSLSS